MGKLEEYEGMYKESSIVDIAMVKSYVYGMEYDTHSGREVEKQGYHYLKQGYIDGFLAGMAYRFGGDDV